MLFNKMFGRSEILKETTEQLQKQSSIAEHNKIDNSRIEISSKTNSRLIDFEAETKQSTSTAGKLFCAASNSSENYKSVTYNVASTSKMSDLLDESKKKLKDDNERKTYLRRHSNAVPTSSNSKRLPSKTSQQDKKKSESFKQFIAGIRKQSQAKDQKEDPVEEYVKDDYAKAESCKDLFRQETGIVYDEEMVLHECLWDPSHKENPERYQAILNRFKELNFLERCYKIEHDPASKEEITAVHTEELYEKLRIICEKTNLEDIEKDASNYDSVFFNEHTFKVAKLAVGGAIALVNAVCKGYVQNGMAIIRPPGHNAMSDAFCGYGVFNNVAIAAQYALDQKLAKKILIVDVDVHHGQGTQRFFYKDNRVLYFSIHRYEHGNCWPHLRESDYDYIGEESATGFNINFPLNRTGLRDSEYLHIIIQILLPVAYEYQPELIIVSAGYNACMGCPEGQMNVTPGFYGHLITLLSGLACGKIAVCLEGGYFAPSLAEGAAMTLRALLGDPCVTLQPLVQPDYLVLQTINNLKLVLHDYWNCFAVYPIYSELVNDPEYHKATIRYEGRPKKAPFNTKYHRDPALLPECIDRVSTFFKILQRQYAHVGLNTKVSCCYDEDMLLHRSNKLSHVETPERLRETYSLYREWNLDFRCLKLEPRVADADILKSVHEDAYVDGIFAEKFESCIDKNRADMFFNEHSLGAITKAAGCLLSVVDSVMQDKAKSGFALIRPPGHHADKNKPSGFCYVNNVAVAAQYILDYYPNKKILIIDFDIHHGNGTQNIFYENQNVLYLSIHRYDEGKYFPCSMEGNIDRCGKGDGEGYNVNVAVNKDRLSNIDYISIFHRIVLPIAYSYAPDVILVSAGFDAGINDKLGNYFVTPDCFGHFIQMLKPLARGRLILALEGGYNPTTVKYSMNICIKTLLGDPLPILDFTPSKISETCFTTLDAVIKTQEKYWPTVAVDKKLYRK